VGELLVAQLEHEVLGEALSMAVDLLVEALGRLAIESRQIGIEHHPHG